MSLRVFIYDQKHVISDILFWFFQKKELKIVNQPKKADVAFAPYYCEKLLKDVDKPKYGTLIFHPSLLPRHRGPTPLRWVFLFGEKYTGACWYWACEVPYGGDICEMEVLAIQEDEFPNEFYDRAVIPAAAKMAFYIVGDLSQGIVRKRPQNQEAATIEP